MDYQSFIPQSDLKSLVKCYWSLEVPAEFSSEKQSIVPDGCIELIFMLGDDIKRFTSSENFIIQPRAFVVGQLTEPFIIQPTGYVNCFAVRFYPYGFANFVDVSIKDLANKETHLNLIFGDSSKELCQEITKANDTQKRIKIIEDFLLSKLGEKSTIDNIIGSTIQSLLSTNGNLSINEILKDDISKRRQLERKFSNQIGISPKQLGRVIRLQTALKMLLHQKRGTLTEIAYESEYYDQAHFIKDFKEFTGINPKEFLADNRMALSTLFYTQK